MCARFTLLLLLAVFPSRVPAIAGEFDLRPLWDPGLPLKNPHKGWYHHFPDNNLSHYIIRKDEHLLTFPGMDHLYIRLAWAYLEPREGQLDWKTIDDLVQKWTAHGLGFAFRISCKETSTERIEQQFATPKWVMEAGARGGYFRGGKPCGPDGPWEPVFDDPIFLQKLDRFMAAFAQRFDGHPRLRYVDVGSVGDWGEGHTWFGSRQNYNYEQRKLHIDLHLRHFKKTQIVVSDDFVYGAGDATERQKLHDYVLANGISYRDDSILVDGYFAGHSSTYTVRSPEFFTGAAPRFPTVLELEHYGSVKKLGNWHASPGSNLARYGGGLDGAEFLRRALALLQASYIGYHGDAADWLRDNPELTVELLNRCGYWYFPHSLTAPGALRPGQSHEVAIVWENRGVAPAYNAFDLIVRLQRGGNRHDSRMPSENREWLPGKAPSPQAYAITLPPEIPPGEYELKFKLLDATTQEPVWLPLRSALLDGEGFYLVGRLPVTE